MGPPPPGVPSAGRSQGRHPQDVQVARRVVVEEVPFVEAGGPVRARSSIQNWNALRSTPNPEPGSQRAMMSRRARPSARTNRTAPTAPCVPVDRDGAPVPRSIPTEAGPVTGNGSCTSVEGGSERSTGSPGGPHPAPWPHPRSGAPVAARRRDRPGAVRWPIYLTTHTDRFYDHFVWQAAAFLEGQAAIRYPVVGVRTTAGNAYFQDVLPIVTTTDGPARLLPFPPLPAVLLMPFVAVWGLATDDQRLFTILAAVDVGRSAGGCSADSTSASRSGLRPPRSSPSGRCSGTRPSSRRPGTRPISSRSG